jgi:serine/threonine-protein kinase
VTKRLLALGDFQDEVVARLAEMLGVKVPTKAGDMLTAGTTKNSEAYADYTQARGFLLDYAKAESLESAIRLFQSAVDKDPQYALAYAGLGEAYWRKHENSKDPQWADDAIENCRRAIRINDHLIPVRVTLGMIYAGTGKNGDAIRELQQVLETDPGNSDALRELADAYGTAGKLKEAEDMYRSVIRLKPNYWLGYHRLGTFYFQQGRYPEAARAFQEVITLAPDNAKAYSNLGGMYYLMERPDEAVKMYERSIEIKPTYGGYMNLGTLNFQEKRFKNAARAYEEALKLNDKEYRIWKFLAACYGQIPDERQKLEEAEKRALELEEALLKINPEDPMLLAQLTMSYVEFHQPEKAAECLEKAVSLKPTSGDVLYQIAEGYEALGKRDDALTYLEEAIKRGFPSLNNLKNSSTPVLQSLRKDPRFSELLRRVEKNNPQP